MIPHTKNTFDFLTACGDLTTVFDCVKHEILLQESPNYGIRIIPTGMVKIEFIKKRTMRKIIRTFISNKKTKPGVPQGSILGPIFLFM